MPDPGMTDQERISALEVDLATIADGLAYLTLQRDPSAVRSWFDVDDVETAQLWLAELAQWLDRVWVRYPRHGLTECWPYHPAVVEELLVVMDLHKAVFRKGGTHKAHADWQASYRPGAAARLREYAPSCTFTQHMPGEDFDPAAPTSVGSLDALPAVAEHWVTAGTCPHPT